MFCSNCGKEIPSGAMFCPNCGAKASSAPELSNPTSMPPADSAGDAQAVFSAQLHSAFCCGFGSGGLLWVLVQRNREEITDKFGRCFPDVSYYQADVLQEKIRASHFKKKNKAAMYKLVELLKKVQSIDKALEKLEANGYDTSGLLKKFEKLGISPVPLRKDFCAERLPNLVELLNTVGDEGGIVVPYTVVKYK